MFQRNHVSTSWRAASALLFLSAADHLLACGPFLPEALFTHKLHPDFPLGTFARGQLGVIKPTYARSYLYVAYRYLNGIGFDADEQKALVRLWDERLNPKWDEGQGWIKDWLSLRNRAPGIKPTTIEGLYFRDPYSYQWLPNCLEDTFRSAKTTLEARIKAFGLNSRELREWIAGQDQVLANCSATTIIPEPLTNETNPLLRADRTYQIAAAHFYSYHFDVAEKMFRDIAADRSSPWNKIAAYLVARTLVRKANDDPEALRSAEKEIKKILTDESLNSMRVPALQLLGFIRYRLEPEQRQQELAELLLKNHSAATLKNDLWDYTWLLDGQKIITDDLTDWIVTFQQATGWSRDHAVEMWRKTHSTAWLVSAITKIDTIDAEVDGIDKAAAEIPPSHPGYLTTIHHRVRLLMQAGKATEARKILDAALSRKVSMPISAENALRGQRLILARTTDEFMNYATRRPTMVTDNEDGQELPGRYAPNAKQTYFDSDAVDALNHGVPLSTLKTIAQGKELPAHLRRELLLVIWTRAVLLEDDAVVRELARIVQEMVPALSELMLGYLNAPTREERRFIGAYIIGKNPGLRPYLEPGLSRTTRLDWIDDYGKNWWCNFTNMHAATPPLEFLTMPQQNAARIELSRLFQVKSASDYLSSIVIDWARRHPEDARVPEALHRTVRSTRYGCTMTQARNYSLEAFQLLHKNYPKSEWTKKTPYWF